MSISNSDIEHLCDKVIDVKLSPSSPTIYDITRKDTFVRYYKTLTGKISPCQLAALTQALIKGDDASIKTLYEEGILDKLYDTNKSITQSLRSQAGKGLETIIETKLNALNISYGKQVFIKNNIVTKKTKKVTGGHTLDFVVPKPLEGYDIKECFHISSKTTLRERVHQDQHIQCKKNIVITYDTKTKQASANGFQCITLTRGNETEQLDCLSGLLCE
jgi:hypothetical protein